MDRLHIRVHCATEFGKVARLDCPPEADLPSARLRRSSNSILAKTEWMAE